MKEKWNKKEIKRCLKDTIDVGFEQRKWFGLDINDITQLMINWKKNMMNEIYINFFRMERELTSWLTGKDIIDVNRECVLWQTDKIKKIREIDI